LPRPPADLAGRTLPVRTVSVGETLPRFHDARHGPVFFNRTRDYRWNAPQGSYGVCYAGLSLEASFAETFLRTPGATLISMDLVETRALSRLVATREIRLVEMADTGLARLGATSAVCSILPYDLPQEWSAALYAHPERPDGILYRSSHDDGQFCAALFEPAGNALEDDGRRETNLLACGWFWDLMDRYLIGLPPGAL
jgi:hypothetical protein